MRNIVLKYTDEQIIDMYNNGTNMTKIGQLNNCSYTTINTKLKELGVKIKTNKDYKKYQINEQYFDAIDTEEKAYFLGFIFADAYIGIDNGMIKLTLQDRDRYILEKMCECLGYTRPLDFELSNNPNHRNQFGVSITNKHMCDTIFSLGRGIKRNDEIKVPDISNELLHHFVRGYFDGDGSIVSREHREIFTITSTYKMVKELQDILVKNCNLNYTKFGYKCADDNSYSLQYVGVNNIVKIRNWLYKDSTIYLQRKYDKMFDIKENKKYEKNKKVFMYDKTGTYISEFNNAKEAAKFINGIPSCVNAVCCGKEKSYKGYLFKY